LIVAALIVHHFEYRLVLIHDHQAEYASNPGRNSAMGGRSGSASAGLVEVTATARSAAGSHCGRHGDGFKIKYSS
jgi:hypothetical protein